MTSEAAISVVAGPADPAAFAPFGAFVEPPLEVGGRARFDDWLEPVAGLAPSYHLNRAPASTFPVTVRRVERHPHAAQLFIPVGVSRYLVTVMPADESGAPDAGEARSFVVPGTMGVAYRPGTWHTGISALDGESSFAVMMWRGTEDDDVFADIPAVQILAGNGDLLG
ncbi:MAG: ureidoglycolate lyase [Gemmatimonadetes bacterium]|nr:ureidoglycolate lyase [Gemmatimonadota bacterium]